MRVAHGRIGSPALALSRRRGWRRRSGSDAPSASAEVQRRVVAVATTSAIAASESGRTRREKRLPAAAPTRTACDVRTAIGAAVRGSSLEPVGQRRRRVMCHLVPASRDAAAIAASRRRDVWLLTARPSSPARAVSAGQIGEVAQHTLRAAARQRASASAGARMSWAGSGRGGDLARPASSLPAQVGRRHDAMDVARGVVDRRPARPRSRQCGLHQIPGRGPVAGEQPCGAQQCARVHCDELAEPVRLAHDLPPIQST